MAREVTPMSSHTPGPSEDIFDSSPDALVQAEILAVLEGEADPLTQPETELRIVRRRVRLVPELLGALEEHQWVYNEDRYFTYCPSCEAIQENGEDHREGCKLAALIAKAKGEQHG